jgi:hypothetical protein
VEINGDGILDILSGSYSRQGEDMAGLFQVLLGEKGGKWKAPTVLNGSDGQPLIMPRVKTSDGDDGDLDRICTRPFAVDLDGDGKLDIVAGNFRGTFGFFRGEGPGKFAPTCTWLEHDGKPLAVEMHSDPFFIDHDGDGDLDLFSGSAQGGAFLFPNVGTKTTPKFGARITLLAAKGHGEHDEEEPAKFGDAHIKAPQADTRVWLADVDGDKKLDLLLGDQFSLMHLADGVDAKAATEKLAAWKKKQQELFKGMGEEQSEEAQEKFQKAYEALEKEKATFAKDQMTGTVWLMRGK